jgi:hypothetical protein
MKPLTITLFLLAAIALARAGSKTTFHGEISDTQCAMNVHSLSRSHEEMITKHTIGRDAVSCAKACVRRGGEWVLRSGDDIYRLKNQAGIEEFSAQKVQITGTLDTKTNTIDNMNIEAAPAARHTPH